MIVSRIHISGSVQISWRKQSSFCTIRLLFSPVEKGRILTSPSPWVAARLQQARLPGVVDVRIPGTARLGEIGKWIELKSASVGEVSCVSHEKSWTQSLLLESLAIHGELPCQEFAGKRECRWGGWHQVRRRSRITKTKSLRCRTEKPLSAATSAWGAASYPDMAFVRRIVRLRRPNTRGLELQARRDTRSEARRFVERLVACPTPRCDSRGLHSKQLRSTRWNLGGRAVSTAIWSFALLIHEQNERNIKADIRYMYCNAKRAGYIILTVFGRWLDRSRPAIDVYQAKKAISCSVFRGIYGTFAISLAQLGGKSECEKLDPETFGLGLRRRLPFSTLQMH